MTTSPARLAPVATLSREDARALILRRFRSFRAMPAGCVEDVIDGWIDDGELTSDALTARARAAAEAYREQIRYTNRI
jgi:hypothetical protein